MDAPAQLFEVTATGPRSVPIPGDVGDVNELFDELPLGVYEGLRTFEHVRFLGLAEHVERARRSVARLGQDDPLDERALRAALHEAVSAYPADDARVRFDVLAAPAPELGVRGRVLIALSPLVPVPDDVLQNGAHVALVRDLRRRDPLVKRADFVIARRTHPSHAEAYEPIMVDEHGRLLEGTSSTFFGVLDGCLRTAGRDVLEGVTAAFLARLARELDVPLRREAVRLDDLEDLGEAFLSSSIRSVVPITRIGDVRVADGRPGRTTRALAEAYARLARREARPAVETARGRCSS